MPVVPPRPRRTLALLAVALTAATALLTSCAGPDSGRLLVGSAPDLQAGQADPPTRVWSVAPGAATAESNLVAERAEQPLGISSLLADGRAWYNQLGRDWKGKDLLAYQTADGSRLTLGAPGGTPSVIDEVGSQERLSALVLQRGVAVITADDCRLSTDGAPAERIGSGRCQISEDERWVVSWPEEPGNLTIRNLPDDSTRTVRGLSVLTASVLGRDQRVLVVDQDGATSSLVLLDAGTGERLWRSDTYDALDVVPATNGATGFVALARTGEGTQLLWISTAGELSVIDEAPGLLPVAVTDHVVYLRLEGAEGTGDAVRSWEPGGEPEELLKGRVWAGAAVPGEVVLARATDTAVEFYRSEDGGEPAKVTSLPIEDPADAATTSIDNMVVTDRAALMVVTVGRKAALARVEFKGDGSDVPVTGFDQLQLQAMDADGTALLVGLEPDSERQKIMVLGPHDDGPTTRLSARATGINLIRGGRLWVTKVDEVGQTVNVVSVRVSGPDDEEVVYRNRQVVGATWPELGGATGSAMASRELLARNSGGTGGTGG